MDQAEFEVLYREHYPVLVGQLALLCGDRAEAADCVQEAFVRAWEHRRSLRTDAGGWLRTAAVRVAVSRWRKTRTSAVAWVRWGSREQVAVPEHVPGLDERSPLAVALRALPERQREAIVLHHVMDMSVAQVADLLGVPDGTVKAWLSRGRAALARTVEDPDRAVAAGAEELSA